LLKHDIAVVLLNVSMPRLDGFELADMIRQHPRFEQTPIIFVSAVHMTDLDRLKAYQRGGVDYVSVPMIPEILRAKVRVFAVLHRKSRQLTKLNEGLRLLSRRLLTVQDAERRHIAPPTTCQQTVKNQFLGSERQISQSFRACSAGDDTCSTLHDNLYARGIIRLDRCHKFEIDKV